MLSLLNKKMSSKLRALLKSLKKGEKVKKLWKLAIPKEAQEEGKLKKKNKENKLKAKVGEL